MTKKKDSPFKVDMNSEDVLVAGGTEALRSFFAHEVELRNDIHVRDLELNHGGQAGQTRRHKLGTVGQELRVDDKDSAHHKPPSLQ